MRYRARNILTCLFAGRVVESFRNVWRCA